MTRFRGRGGRSIRLLLLCGILPAVAVALLALSRPGVTVRFDDTVYDYALRWAGTRAPAGRVAIVDIDERSLAKYGQWPWHRDLIARLVARVRDAGASVVALDIIFAEPDRSGDEADRIFGDVLREGRVVLGYGLIFDTIPGDAQKCVLHPFSIALAQRGDHTTSVPLFRATEAVCTLPALAHAAGATGFLNAAPDRGGILRRAPLVAELDGRIYPSLALAAVTKVTGAANGLLHGRNETSASLALGNVEVPLDGKGNLLLRFRGEKKTFPYLSAGAILDGRADWQALREKVVLVGTTALGTREVVATPLDTLFVGVEVQATVVDNLLQGDFIRRPVHQGLIESGITIVTGLGVALLAATSGVLAGTLSAVAALVALWIGAVWLLTATGVFVSPLFPTLGWLAAIAAVSLARFSLERRRADNAGMERTAARTLMIQALLSLTEVRDAETGKHSRRTQQYTKLLAQELACHPRFRKYLTPERIELLASLAPLHDIGKVGVPDSILNKPGALTPDELAEMRRHTVYGRDVILNAERKAAVHDEAILSLAKEIVYTHHERWDGAGYPEGLRGEAIPIPGRILAVVDVYDATTTRTLYRPSMSHQQAIAFIVKGESSHFDPAVVEAFLRVAPSFEALSTQTGAESVPAGCARHRCEC